ncbi:type IV pilus secretin PilQ [Cardiobacteriaceae bacterium TAE3-ERU3]|nr:type IV pilus secretin PilQ [Cardiobacteriaceae bacterium TAE3-ERU3]
MKKLSLGFLIALQCNVYAASINGVSSGFTQNGKYELVFENVGKMPRAFTTANPYAIVLDFAETDSSLKEREINIAANGIYDVDVIEGEGRTRVVVNLVAARNYNIQSRGRDIVLTFDDIGRVDTVASVPENKSGSISHNSGALFNSFSREGGQGTKSSQVSKTLINQTTDVTPTLIRQPEIATNDQVARGVPTSPLQQAVLDPVYTQKKGGVGLLSFALPKSISNVNVRQDGNKVIAYLDGFYVTKADQKRMEVGSYATPVDNIDIYRSARGTELVLNIKRNIAFEYASYQNGDVYTIEVKPEVSDNSLQKQVDELQGFSPTKRYRGAPLSLNFQDIEVRAVLQIIAEFTNNNIVVSDAVTGNITLRLDSVPWDQALDIILKTKGLGMRENGSVIYIAPASELDQRELNALKVIQERDQLVPARTELIQIKYANAAEIATILEGARARGSGDRASFVQDSILSAKGTVSVDKRTNTLLISDIPSKLQAARDLIAKLDEPVRQVLVDARLVLTTDNFTRDLGARFGLTFFNSKNGRLISGSGSSEGAYGLGESVHNAIVDSAKGKDATIEIPGLSNRLGVNMPVAGSSYGLAILGADFLVDLELSALQTEGKAEIISSPRVVTQDGKQARIASGQQIPYETVSGDGTQVQFQNAELSLDVTPRIAPDNRVDLLLNVTNDKPDPSIRSTAGNVGITTNHLETNVLVDNGETIVLGGVYQQEQSLSTNKVPLLGDLPIIGNAFKTTNKRYNKSELLIFVTPRIIDNNLSDYDKFSNLRN